MAGARDVNLRREKLTAPAPRDERARARWLLWVRRPRGGWDQCLGTGACVEEAALSLRKFGFHNTPTHDAVRIGAARIG